MDTIRSYLNKVKKFPRISTSGSLDIKKDKGSSRIDVTPTNSRLRLFSDNSLAKHCATPTLKSPYNSDPNLQNLPNALSDKNETADWKGVSNSGEIQDSEKTSPPAKPPRRDQIIKVEINCESKSNLGILIDAVTQENSPAGKGMSPEGQLTRRGETRWHGVGMQVTRLLDGGLAQQNGKVNVHDVILDINGWSLNNETVSSSSSNMDTTSSLESLLESLELDVDDAKEHRLLLANAVRSGKVVLTLRRRKKRPAPPPPDYPEQFGNPNRNSSPPTPSKDYDQSVCIASKLSHSTDCIVVNSGTCSKNSSTFTLNSVGDSADEFLGSTDDVFIETHNEKPVRGLAPSKGRKLLCESLSDVSHNASVKSVNGNESNCAHSDKKRTQSASALEKSPQVSQVSIDLNEAAVDYVNTAEMARRRRGKGALDMVIDNNITSYRSDPELINIQKYNQRKSKKMWKLEERTGAQTPTSCSSFDLQGNNSSHSRLPKKRIVTKMHLLKDETGLGIHIAGGKGSSKGDIGIFVAGLLEGGAAQRDGRLKRGDELLMINGKSLIGLTHSEAVEVLKSTPKLVQIVVASKVKKPSVTSPAANNSFKDIDSDNVSKNQTDDSKNSDSVTDESLFNTPPELKATTPQGTIMKWEELFEPKTICINFQHTFSQERNMEHNKCTNNFEQKFSRPSTSPPQGDKKKRFEDPVSITLMKGTRGKGLGFTIVGGCDSERGPMGIYVRRILHTGLVYEDGSIKEGDEIVEINDEPMAGLSHQEAVDKFRKLKKGPVKITYKKRVKSRPTSPKSELTFSSYEGSPVSSPGHSPYSSFVDLTQLSGEEESTETCASSSMDTSLQQEINRDQSAIAPAKTESSVLACIEGDIPPSPPHTVIAHREVILHKENGIGLGVSLLRRDHNGASQIYIQDIAPGSAAEKDGRLKKGDMIMEVNGTSLQDTTLIAAYQTFRNLSQGPVILVVKRGIKFKTITFEENPWSSESMSPL